MLYLHYIPDISTFLGVGRIDLRDAAEYGLLKSFIIPIQSIYNHMDFFLRVAFVRVVKESPNFSIPYMTCLSYRTLPKQLGAEPFASLHECLLLPELLFFTCPQASIVSRKTIILGGG